LDLTLLAVAIKAEDLNDMPRGMRIIALLGNNNLALRGSKRIDIIAMAAMSYF
jgi:hypothetical protein